MLKHLPYSHMDFLLHIFNLSWSLHSSPSIWKTSSIISIHKMGKPLDSPASFRPISLTSCVSKLFERIVLSRLLFFLESNFILSPRQASFHPGRSTLDQILYLSQSISDGFNKPRPGSRTILSTIDFSKAFDSVWHQGSVLGPVLFSLFINDFPASLLSSVSCSLYADDLAIGPPPPRSPLWWRPHKELCFDWSAGLITGVFSIRANVRPPSSRWIPTKLTSSPTSSYSAPTFVPIPFQPFLASHSTALFSFQNMYLR